MPNAWDAGSARLLEWSGFEAIAHEPRARGIARTPRPDVTLDELLAHVEALAAASRSR